MGDPGGHGNSLMPTTFLSPQQLLFLLVFLLQNPLQYSNDQDL